MFALLHQKIKIKNLKRAAFVFVGVFLLSLGAFSFADTENTSTKNIFEDTDQDGLSNDEERLYGTNPEKSDSDGDGYTDGTEIKSGYNPLLAAPGDKIVLEETSTEKSLNVTDVPSDKKTNLTEEVSRQVALTLKESASKQESLSLDELRTTVQQTMSQKITVDKLPDIDVESIKIKKQNYSDLTEADKTAKIKEDTLAYVTAVSFILINNSPVAIQSDNDAQKYASFVTSNAMDMLSGKNKDMLQDISTRGALITEQLQSVIVPENMLEMHVKALKLGQYAVTFKDTVASTGQDDPLAQINSFAKAQGFISLFSGFVNDMNSVLTQYGIQIPI